MGILEIFIVLVILAFLQIGPYAIYLMHMKRMISKPWNIKIDPNYRPRVTIIVPTYQEADVIETKLQNLNSLIYPEDKLEVIIVDSASTDGTLEICKKWLSQNNFKFKVIILTEPKRISKAHALNYALKYASGEVIVTTDADAILAPDVLMKSIPYLADINVGAISGKEEIINRSHCFIAYMETLYRNTYYLLRLGESKLHSTQIFQGEFAAYKREIIEHFIEVPGRADDNSAVTEILKKGKRCLFVPEAIFYDAIPCNLIDYLKIKIRRASQLQKEFLIRFKLWVRGELKIPKALILANVYQHFISPLIFALLTPIAIYFILRLSTTSILLLAILVSTIIVISLTLTHTLTLYIISNIVLIIAVIRNLISSKTLGWEAIRSSRKYLSKNLKLSC